MLRSAFIFFALVIYAVALANSDPAKSSITRERLSLDRGWQFHLGEIADPEIHGHDATYMNAKAGQAHGAASPGFDDSDWRTVDLPHDWVVEGPFDEHANVSQGYRPRGIGWYRRRFKLDPEDRGKHLEIQLDGIATYATVWLNGTVIHRNWCGYTSCYLDITPLAEYGDSVNTLVVRADANAMEGWWYEGGGIYRHTWLIKRNTTHIITDGVHADPVKQTDGTWLLPVEVTVENIGHEPVKAEVESRVLDQDGKEISRGSGTVLVEALAQAEGKFEIKVQNPKLWTLDSPHLYQVQTSLIVGGHLVDKVVTKCGFRTLRFDADQGFFLNDKHVKLQGVCNHQDHAGVGVAVPDSIWEFRIRKLKEMGVNAYRCAHNPPSVEFLDACDRHGILVMDENRVFNTSPEYQRQLEWLVRRDRNHPSVFMWSVFNEEPMQGTEQGYEMVRRMASIVKRLDKTRPVTAAMNGGLFTPLNVSHAVDVVGFNYQIGQYDAFHAENPKLPMTSSEDTSAFMTRGEYVTDDIKQIKDCYDTQAAPWGATHREAWKAIETRPYLAGGFVWTGFDYRGEPTPFRWPSAGSFFGIMDLCGFPKGAFFIHQAQWVKDRPILQILPHWNWEGSEARNIKVMVCSNAETVALSLNGRDLGEKPIDPFEMVEWQVPYEPGALLAVAKVGGKVVSRQSVETTGKPTSLRLTPDRAAISGDGLDAVPVTVEAIDSEGRHVPTANLPLHFSITGPGSIIGLGNGDPNSHEPEKGFERSLFNGYAQAIVQSHYESHGDITLTVSSPGLGTDSHVIVVRESEVHPFVEPTKAVLHLDNWRHSPFSADAPDPNHQLADNDQNSWERIHPGKLQVFSGGKFAVYRTHFLPTHKMAEVGGRVLFTGIAGRAEFWLDGTKVATKDGFETTAFEFPIAPGKKEHVISILIEASERGGFAGTVSAVANTN